MISFLKYLNYFNLFIDVTNFFLTGDKKIFVGKNSWKLYQDPTKVTLIYYVKINMPQMHNAQ